MKKKNENSDWTKLNYDDNVRIDTEIEMLKAELERKIEMQRDRAYLNKFSIWQGKNGRWYTYIYNEGKRTLIARRSKEILEQFLISFCKNSPEDKPVQGRPPRIADRLNFAYVFQEWIEWKLNYDGLSKRSYDRYYSDYLRFFKKENPICNIPFQEITESDLELFIRESIIKNKLTAKAWGKLRLVLTGTFKYGKKHGYTDVSITNFLGDNLDLSSRIFTKQIVKDEEEVFTEEEKQLLTNYIKDHLSLKGLGILLIFQSGLRSGELSALTFTDITEGKNFFLRVNKTEIFYNDDTFYKNGKKHRVYEIREFPKSEAGVRTVLLPQTEEMKFIIEKLKELSQPNSDNFIFFERNKRIHAHAFSRKLNELCEKVGIPPRPSHKARKTYSTQLINRGVDKNIIKKQMGHIDFSTTDKFYFFNNKKKEALQEEINHAFM